MLKKNGPEEGTERSIRLARKPGAGDDFLGAFLARLARSGKRPGELTPEEAGGFAVYANAAALCVGRRSGISAMPAAEQAREKMKQEGIV